MIKEFMEPEGTLEWKYPAGSIHEFDGKKYRAVKVLPPIPSTSFASFPQVVFEEQEEGADD